MMLKKGLKKKKNPLLDFIDVQESLFSINDNVFLKDNPYGYVSNLKNPDVIKMYKDFCKFHNERILSDEQRFHFDNSVIKKFRPSLKKRIEKYEREEGSAMIKNISTDTGTGVQFLFDEGRKNEKGNSEEWVVKYPNSDIHELETEWFTDGREAFKKYHDISYAILAKRIHGYYNSGKGTPV